MKTGIIKTAAVAVAFAVGASGTALAADESLKAGFFIGSPKSLFRITFDKFVAHLNADAGAGVKIGQLVGSEAVPSQQMPNALRSGVLDVVGAPPSYFSKFVPGAAGYSAPRVSFAKQRENGAWELVREEFAQRANAHLLAQYGEGVRFHIFTQKPIRSIADFKDVKLRTSNTYQAFFEALGAKPLQMSRSEIFTALERGVVEGFGNLNSEVKALGWGEVIKYRVDPSFYDTTVFVGVNLDKWKSLNAQQQAALTSAGMHLETTLNKELAEADVAAGKELAAAGAFEIVTLPEDEAKRYVDMAYDAIWATVEKRSPEFGGKARKLLMP
mgnify:CR=1 FL=1